MSRPVLSGCGVRARRAAVRAWARAHLAPALARLPRALQPWGGRPEPFDPTPASVRPASVGQWHRRGVRAGWCFVAVLVLAIAASASYAGAQPGVLDETQSGMRDITRTWLYSVTLIGRRLFMGLAAIEVTISAVIWLLRSDDLTEVARRFLLKFILMSFCLMLITGAGVWLPPIVNGLAYAGQILGSVRVPPGPSEILDMGFKYNYFTQGTGQLPVWPPSAIMAVVWLMLTELAICVACIAAAVQLLLLWVEAYVALGGGVIFLGFAGFRATAGYAEGYLNYLVYLGVRLFTFYLCLSLGYGIAIRTQFGVLGGTGTIQVQDLAASATMAAVFALMVIRIPANVAGRVAGGGHTLGIGHALRNL